VTQYYDHRTAISRVSSSSSSPSGGDDANRWRWSHSLFHPKGYHHVCPGMLLTALVFCLYVLLESGRHGLHESCPSRCDFLGIIAGTYLLFKTGELPRHRALSCFLFEPLGDLGLFTVLSWFLSISPWVPGATGHQCCGKRKRPPPRSSGILIGNLLAIPIPLLAASVESLREFDTRRSLPSGPFLRFWATFLLSSPSFFCWGCGLLMSSDLLPHGCNHDCDSRLRSEVVPSSKGQRSLGCLEDRNPIDHRHCASPRLLCRRILRNVTEIAVLLSSVVILVCSGPREEFEQARWFLSLLASVVLLALAISTGWRTDSSFLVVAPATFIILSLFKWIESRK